MYTIVSENLSNGPQWEQWEAPPLFGWSFASLVISFDDGSSSTRCEGSATQIYFYPM